MLKRLMKRILGYSIIEQWRNSIYTVSVVRRLWGLWGTDVHECTVCGFMGRFRAAGIDSVRYGAMCPKCHSVERHRLFCLAIKKHGLFDKPENIIHFAPESCLRGLIKQHSSSYKSADFVPGRGDLTLNIEKILLPDKSVDVVIANHVMEHVDDFAAFREIHRILSDGGRMIISVPITYAWEKTYENPTIVSEVDRELYFGQNDHVRRYGRDFKSRILATGFSVVEFTCGPEDTIKYALERGDTIFICTKIGPTVT
jgi:SAM-dependent methyltransferase